jgi:hypothetical protein
MADWFPVFGVVLFPTKQLHVQPQIGVAVNELTNEHAHCKVLPVVETTDVQTARTLSCATVETKNQKESNAPDLVTARKSEILVFHEDVRLSLVHYLFVFFLLLLLLRVLRTTLAALARVTALRQFALARSLFRLLNLLGRSELLFGIPFAIPFWKLPTVCESPMRKAQAVLSVHLASRQQKILQF